MCHIGQVHRAAFAVQHAVGAAEQLADGRGHRGSARQRMTVAAIRAERVVVISHGHRAPGGDSLLAERKVAGASDQVLDEQLVGALLEIAKLDHHLVEAQSGFLVDACHGSGCLVRAGFQYLFAIISSSAGNSVITSCPLAVTTSSSSIRAAECPSSAGQYVSSAKTMPSWSSIGSSSELRRLMMGRSCSASPRPWPNCSPKASISSANPNSSAFGHVLASRSVEMPGFTRSIAASIHSRAFVYASRWLEVARPTAKVR